MLPNLTIIYRVCTAAVIGLPLLASCQTGNIPQPPVVEENVNFIAKGNEPGWIVRFDAKTIAFEGDYGEKKITVPKPEGRASFNGMRYVTDRLSVDVTHVTCTDDMSGRRFAETVKVIADGKEFNGCGGRNLPPETLEDTVWTIVAIDQLPVLAEPKTEVRFTRGRVSGTAGCNRFSGPYKQSKNILTFSGVSATEMACQQNQMTQEMAFMALLTGPVTERYSVEGNLILANDKGNRVTLKQVL